MIKWSDHERDQSPREEKTQEAEPGDDSRADIRSREDRQCRGDLSPRGNQPRSVLTLEEARQRGTSPSPKREQERQEGCRRSSSSRTRARERATQDGAVRIFDRTSIAEKKRELGLVGDLRGRHLDNVIRSKLLYVIDQARDCGISQESICETLKLNPRAVIRWRSGETHKSNHGGGGGRNRIQPHEEEIVLVHARLNPEASCRRIAYDLERKRKAFIGKTKVSEILKAHGLNRPKLSHGNKKPVMPPLDYLLHEPWAPNLLWGMDWTWIRVGPTFMFLQIVVDWYSRLIVSWGLFHQITQAEVIATVTDAVARQEIDLLPENAMRPRVVADHGSANIGKLTRANIEVQGLDLWLSGIGRPTGNARTERTIGTLKTEEITLQSFYSDEATARRRIHKKIWDYNNRRPNQGNGGFAPALIHRHGRKKLMEQRKLDRQRTNDRRKEYWNQQPPTPSGLT